MYMESSHVPKAGPQKGSESGIDTERNAGERSRRAVTLAYAGGATPVLQDVPLASNKSRAQPSPEPGSEHSRYGPRRPRPRTRRSGTEPGVPGEPRLTEPPVVEEMPEGYYRLCAGERRVQAARLAGWTDIPCLIYPPMDPAHAHTLSLVENIHRAPMHPLEEISSLCISRLLANADARRHGTMKRELSSRRAGRTPLPAYEIIRGLETCFGARAGYPRGPT